MDPIQREDFNIHCGREANPERIARIKFYASQKDAAKDALENEIRAAMMSGHSYRQVADAAGVSVMVVRRIMSEGN